MDYDRLAEATEAANALLSRSESSETHGSQRLAIRRQTSRIDNVRLQISARKKAFVFVVVVDCLLTLILWLLVGAAEDLLTTLKSVNVLLQYKTSLFDLVIVSFVRVFILIMWYWIFNCVNRWGVTFTTIGSTVIIVVKCFYYKFGQSHEEYLEYFLVFATAILVWTEFGFYEIRVLPVQRKLQLIIQLDVRETRPIIHQPRSYQAVASPGVPGVQSGVLTPYLTPHGSPRTESPVAHLSVTKEHTPLRTRPNSDEEVSDEDEQLYVQMGRQAVQFCIEAANDTSSKWKTDKILHQGRTVCDSLVRRKPQPKLFRGKSTVLCSPADVFRILYTEAEQQPEWNAAVMKSESLHRIDMHTDIIYNIATEAAGGVVARRDFVSVRYWEKRGDIYISSGKSVEYKRMPEQEGIIRGFNGNGGYVIAPSPQNPAHTQLIWVLDTDLKGWIPQYIIDRALSGVMVTFFSSLADHVDRLRRNGSLSD